MMEWTRTNSPIAMWYNLRDRKKVVQCLHHAQIGASIAIGMVAGLAQNNTQYGTSTSATDAYRQGVANSLSQSSMHVLDRFLNILPTFTIREGQRIKIYLSEDLTLPANENHEMATDL